MNVPPSGIADDVQILINSFHGYLNLVFEFADFRAAGEITETGQQILALRSAGCVSSTVTIELTPTASFVRRRLTEIGKAGLAADLADPTRRH
jgi:hypothetical protein